MDDLAGTASLNWSGDTAMANWDGVAVALGRVVSLDLRSNELSGEIPSELGGLTNLQLLDLSSNQLSGGIPPELGDLTNLQLLWLYTNRLSGGIPSELGDLTNLQLLWLHANRLSGPIPPELGDLTNLQELSLNSNELSGEIPAQLGGLANLQDLSLHSNELSGEIPSELGELTNLKFLDLQSNMLTGCIPSTLIRFIGTVTLQQGGVRLAECGGAGANGAPTFSSAGFFSVAENVTVVGTVVAADTDDSDEITSYAVTGGVDRSLFSIDTNTGVLTFTSPPNFENPSDANTDNDYLVDVTATSGSGDRALTAVQTVTVTVEDVGAEAPAAPRAPTISAITATGFTVSWTEPANTGPVILDYTVRHRMVSGGTWKRQTGISGTSLALTGLAGATEYKVQVRARNAEARSNWSASATGTTTAAGSEACTADSPAVDGITGTGIVDDCNTLLGLMADLDSAGTASLDWSADTAMADWDGVAVGSGRVVALSLENTELSGEIPSELGGLTDLRRLHLHSNRLSGEIPSELGGLTDLRQLHLHSNQLSGEIPSELGGLTDLRRLHLHSNQLSGEIPSELGGLTDLRQLHLHSNQLSGEIPSELGGLTELRQLYLHSNRLSGEIPSELGGLTELGELELHGNMLSGCIPSTLIRFIATVTLQQDGVRLAECGGAGANEVPTFSSAGTFSVAENLTVVGTVVAADTDDSDEITSYEVTGGADQRRLSVDTNTGVLAFASPPNFENPSDANTDNEYLVEVTATGGTGDRALSAAQVITVTVTDADEAPAAPAAPMVSAAMADGFTVSWVAPSNTGPAITGYDVQYREGTSGTWTDAGHAGTGLSITLAGLAAGTSYQVQVNASNAEGTSAWSAVATGTTTAAASEACTADSPAVGGITGTGIVADCNILLGLMADLAGTASLNWSVDTAMANWDGVAVASGRVESLDLDSRKLSGRIPSELGGLTKLVELILSRNGLSGEIPSKLGGLTKLKYLHLSSNRLSGEIPSELGSLTNLRELYLHKNQLSGEIPSELGDLTKLLWLVLHGNQLSGEIPSELGGLTSLIYLYSGSNQLSGEIPSELGGLTSLQYMRLHSNRLSGEIPSELGGLTNLQQLYLSSNQLSGEIPPELNGMTDLRQLMLSSNQLSGEIPSELGGLTKLVQLELHGNMLIGCVPSTLIRFIATVTLQQGGVRLAVCGGPGADETPTSSSAGFFSVAENLMVVGTVVAADTDDSDGITGYALTGGADRSLFSIDTNTGVLAFASPPNFENPSDANTDNDYVVEVTATGGTGDRALTAAQVITVTDADEAPAAPAAPMVSAAMADGITVSWVAPSNTGPAITGYDVQYREGTSGTWTDAGHAGTGLSITLAGLAAGTSYQVQVNASNAEGTSAWSAAATGTTTAAASEACTADSPAVGGITGTDIVADCNILLGLMADLAGTASLNWSADTAMANWEGVAVGSGRVVALGLDNRELSGEIPSELGGLTKLRDLHLDSNRLSGEVPSELGGLANLQSLYLDSNRLSGEIPSELGGLTNLQRLHLDSNRLSGEIPSELGGLTNLQYLWLYSNRLSGGIPSELGGLTDLRQLYLHSNRLSGEIPSELGGLTDLRWLILSGNQLSGEIPSELGGLTDLQYLQLQSNQLSGEIPSGLGGLTNLKSLVLYGNKLSGCIPSTLSGFIARVTLQQDGVRLGKCDGSTEDPAPRRRDYKRSDAQPNRIWEDQSENGIPR